MTAKSSDPPTANPHAPFGAQHRRPLGPLVLLSALYICWVLVLFWMAGFRVGD